MNDSGHLSDGTPLGALDFEGRARAIKLEEEDQETLAWYAAGLEQTMLAVSAFLTGNGDVAEVAARKLRKAIVPSGAN